MPSCHGRIGTRRGCGNEGGLAQARYRLHLLPAVAPSSTKGGSTMKRILLAYDGTPAADTAMSTTVALAKALKAEVGVVSVVPVHPGRTPVDPWDDRPVHTE